MSHSLPPLVLDLDGTVIRTDTFHEMIVKILFERPWVLLRLPFWFLKGRAYAKARLTSHCILSPHELPYNTELLKFARTEAAKGRKLVLATGSNTSVAESIARHLNIFSEVIASNETVNMTGPYKTEALVTRFGKGGFDYAGDSLIDTHVWKASNLAIVVHPKKNVLKQALALKSQADVHHFPRHLRRDKALLHTLRPFFWVFSLLATTWPLVIAFSLLSTALLITNDLRNLVHDRFHARWSVLAEGHLHLVTPLTIIPIFVSFSLGIFLSYSWLGFLFFTIYAGLFLLLDQVTRSLSQTPRWLVLAVFQTMACLLTHYL